MPQIPIRRFPRRARQIPGAGAWLSVITTATSVQPIVAGKPFPFLMDLSMERLGTDRNETLVIGDRLDADIAAGQAVGCPTALSSRVSPQRAGRELETQD